MTEIYEKINHNAPPIMPSLFEIGRKSLNTTDFQILSNNSRRTVNYGLDTIFYRTTLLLANLRREYKFANSLKEKYFQKKKYF